MISELAHRHRRALRGCAGAALGPGLFSLLVACSQPDDIIARAERGEPPPVSVDPCVVRCGSAGCPCPLPDPVVVGAAPTAVAIDRTEVTVRQYAAFLDTGATPRTGPQVNPELCTWNESFSPAVSQLDFDERCLSDFDFEGFLRDDPERPVVCVDWCDAAAFCFWQGGHLCGGTGGALLDLSESGTSEDERYRACSLDGSQSYCYGDTFERTACNVLESGNGSISIPVASLPSCEGPVPGLFDMNGNADEWIALCDDYEAESAEAVTCYRVGGAFFQEDPNLSRCDAILNGRRGLLGNNTGFRCCYAAR